MWNNPRLKKSIRLIIYFSEILPKKFLNINKGDKDLRMKIVRTSRLKPKGSDEEIQSNETESMIGGLGLTWREPYIVYMDENFPNVIEGLYEAKFIDRIFQNGNAISKEQWDKAIVGSAIGNLIGNAADFLDGEESNRNREMLKDMDLGALDWLFSPKKIRLAFKNREKDW